MAEGDDFYDVKGIGKLPEEDADAPKLPDPKMPKPPREHHGKRNVLFVVIAIVVLGGAGAGYWFGTQHKTPAKKASTSTATTAPNSANETSKNTTQYVSNGSDLNLDFNYPNGWRITPASNNNAKDQVITLTSPVVSIPDASGSSTNGKVVVTIRPAGATLSEFGSNSATAAQDSLQVAYSQPTANQHDYTYLTFLHFPSGVTATGAFEEVMVTGGQQFTKGTNISADSIAGLDPIIAANFYKCTTTDCANTGAGPLSITGDTWQNNSFVAQVQTIFESFKLN